MVFYGAAAGDLQDRAGRRKLAEAIGAPGAVTATSPAGEDMERAWLALADGGVAVFCINWGDRPARVEVRLPRGGAGASVLDVSGRSAPLGRDDPIEVPGRDARIVLMPGR